MQWTNIFKLPMPIAEAIMQDLYHGKREEQLMKYRTENNLSENVPHFSVSDLIRPPRMRALLKRHAGEVIKDVSMDIYRVLGNAVHALLYSHAIKARLEGKGFYLAEDRMFVHLKVDGMLVIVSGEPDLVSPEHEIHDYKVTQVWSWIKGVKTEWEQQTNMYAWLRALKGRVTMGLKICFILRDWSVNETVQEGYPQAGAQMMDVKQWTFDEQQAYVEGRIRVHLQAQMDNDDELEDCTGDEMWEKPEEWAVKRDGSQRAAKVVRVPGDEGNKQATLLMEEKNGKLKKNEKAYFVEHRPGERTRCLRFCDARSFCSQFREYSSASFRGDGASVREKVEQVEA